MTQESQGSNADALPDAADPNGLCPRCGRPAGFRELRMGPVSSFRNRFVGTPSTRQRLEYQRATIMECGSCGEGLVVIEDRYVGGQRYGTGGGEVTWRGFHWWPPPGPASLGPEVPRAVADAYSEGQRCLSANAPNGAVAMFRTAMSCIADDKGSEVVKAKRRLKDKIKQIVTEGGLPSAIGEWVDHVRLYGNAGAHPDQLGDVSLDEARDVSGLTTTLIEALYTTPAKIAKRQAERRS